MNANPNAKVVLCYGDSNVFGQKPDKTSRCPADVRWTGQLQDLLGEDYYIIEEGLGGRTTDLDDPRPEKIGRNGRAYLTPCLQSHNPIDLVMIMLGSNDLKIVFNRSVEEIALALAKIVDDIRANSVNARGVAPKVILVGPTAMNGAAPWFAEFYCSREYSDRQVGDASHQANQWAKHIGENNEDTPTVRSWEIHSENYDENSIKKSRNLGPAIEQLAAELGCEFIDANESTKPGEDGLHWDEPSQTSFARVLESKTREIL